MFLTYNRITHKFYLRNIQVKPLKQNDCNTVDFCDFWKIRTGFVLLKL